MKIKVCEVLRKNEETGEILETGEVIEMFDDIDAALDRVDGLNAYEYYYNDSKREFAAIDMADGKEIYF